MKLRGNQSVILAIIVLAIIAILFLFQSTFIGLYEYRVKGWEEQAFQGKPLAQLQANLASRKQTLEWCDVVGFSAITGKNLTGNQRVMRFLKGKPYPWFHLGSAQNAGYVVIEQSPNGEIVVEVIRTIYVDTF